MDARNKTFSALAAAAILLLSGCQPKPSPDDLIGVSLTGVNYTDEGVQEYFVDGTWGGNLPTYGGGGGETCCVRLPREWRPGLQVKVKWTIGHYTQPWSVRKDMSVEHEMRCCWTQRTLEQIVPVKQYEKVAKLQVFFLANAKLEIWITDKDVGHPRHPSGRDLPRDPRPKDVEELP